MSERVLHSHISPSAHFTAYVWYRRGLSDAAFISTFGRFSHSVLRPVMWASRRFFDLDLENMLLLRHLQIDACLHCAIENHGVRQVVEIACGLSPRGRRFTQRYPQLRYMEADLPDMAERKRQLLARNGWLGDRHQVTAVDVFAQHGVNSLASAFAQLDRDEPVLVITEGLVNYFPRKQIELFWTRLAGELSAFSAASYITDLYPELQAHPRYQQIRWGVDLVGKLTRGEYYLHYADAEAIGSGFKACGFAAVEVIDPSLRATDLGLPIAKGPGLVRVVHAHM
ncbi:class I SAM-dependent methyltransferase [Pseudomonas segetis]|uniref:O-Methyltransferase involved in polyketide biosynthesis n=1 Tax=Pseudomonas segetis TaxID=298908 RepID=A0A239H450_9PSED|nr:class I SAM-dependent methyltransferase [Pseudomonas segetis]SNS75808.1 O-Methyltransferase involved in polyketide biosynthesis [Pseudomonas segetis]